MKSILINIKLYYYTFLDFLDDELKELKKRFFSNQSIEKSQENAKLRKGIPKMVARLRGMSVEERLSTENLLSGNSYKKTRKEKLDELKVIDKVIKNPMLRTEDDLVNTVVKKAPMYAKEQELKEVRKAITACIRAAGEDPTNPSHTADARALKAKRDLLRSDIARMKQNG